MAAQLRRVCSDTAGMENHRRYCARKRAIGFSLLELVIAAAISMTLMAIASPYIMNVVYGMRLRYSAFDLGGLMQRTRIEAVRKNTFYSVQQAASVTGAPPIFFADFAKSGTVVSTDPQAQMGSHVNVSYGTGSGAPGETAFVGNLGFAVSASTALPSFNARGLPCVVAGNICPETPGQGFVYFLSNNSMSGGTPGATSWASVVVMPSGRVAVWTYDGANWIQQ
jgi:type II secretory pathway pseudopilin PulG